MCFQAPKSVIGLLNKHLLNCFLLMDSYQTVNSGVYLLTLLYFVVKRVGTESENL